MALDYSHDSLSVTHRVAKLKGHPDFNFALETFLLRTVEIVTDLHLMNIYEFDLRVIDADTVQFQFFHERDAILFKMKWS